MLGRKRSEGRPLPDTPDMKAWRSEFEQMTIEDHDKVLKNLGLDSEDIEEFNETVKKGGKAEELLRLGEGEGAVADGAAATDTKGPGGQNNPGATNSTEALAKPEKKKKD